MQQQQPHDGRAGTSSLPPDVQGMERGVLELRVDNLRWDLPGAPTNVQARVRWWGESGEGAVVKLRPGPRGRDGHTRRFPVRCGPKPLRKYLKDMASLVIIIEDSRQYIHKGTVTVDVRMLDVQTPLVGCYPIVGHNRRALGRVDIHLSLSFHSSVVSSFEMNEYLAATDGSLPLYPLPGKLAAMDTVEEGEGEGDAVFQDPELRWRDDLFAVLSSTLSGKTKAAKLQYLGDVYRSVDRSNRNVIKGEEVGALVKTLLERSKRWDATLQKYITAVLEPDVANAAMSADAVKDVYREATKLQGIFVGRGDVQVVDVLRRLAREAGERRMELKNEFIEAGVVAEGGAMDVTGIVLLMRRLFDWLSRREEWALLAYLYKHDIKSTGKFSFQELKDLLHELVRMDELPVGLGKENFTSQAPGSFSWSNLMSPGKAHPAGDGAAPAQPPPPGVGLSGGAIAGAARLSQGVLYRPNPQGQQQHGWSQQHPEIGPAKDRAADTPVQNDPLADLINRAQRLRTAMDDAIRSGHPIPAEGHWSSSRSTQFDLQQPGNRAGAAPPLYHPPSSPPHEHISDEYLGQLSGSLGEVIHAEGRGADLVQEEIDDLLLDELFLKPSHEDTMAAINGGWREEVRQKAASLPHQDDAAPKVDNEVLRTGEREGEGAADVTMEAGAAQLVPLHLMLSLKGGLEGSESGTQAIIKSAGGVRSDGFFPPGPTDPIRVPIQAHFHPNGTVQLAIELWRADEPAEHSDAARRFLGMATLDCAASDGGAHILDVRNIFKGTLVGQLETELRNGGDAEELGHQEESSGADEVAEAPRTKEAPVGNVSAHISSVQMPRKPHPDDEVAHCFEVTVVSCGMLPSGQQVEMELGLGPETRYIAYTFPGDTEPLYTNEVDPEPEVAFGANAKHTVRLPARESIVSYLQLASNGATEPALEFQVWDRWPSGAGSIVGAGSLPLAAILEACGVEDGRAVKFSINISYDSDAVESTMAGGDQPAVVAEVYYSTTVTPVNDGVDATTEERESSSSDSASAEAEQPGLRPRVDLDGAEGQEDDSQLKAEMCVEIHQAAGLKAAVREAANWLGGGSSVLGRAGQLGPHSYVRLSLFPGDEELDLAVPPLKTPFQAQTFTPKYDFKRQFTTSLTSRLVNALATQELCLEVWHHSPRTQALQAMLGSSRVEPPPGSKPKDVFLGTACTSLLPLLTRSQGLRTWLPLKSRRGEAVGAVQLSVHFLKIGERPNIACHSPLERFPALENMLPPGLGVEHYMPSGFDGQPARASVYIEEAVLPPEEEARIERPSSGGVPEYYATYRLPGSANVEATHSVAGRKGGCSDAGEHRAGRLHLAYCGIHWVTAGAGLAHALSSSLMELELHRKVAPSRYGSPPETLVGFAQVDLMPLMLTISKKGSIGARWVSGTFHLVSAASKDLGAARIRAKVMLELRPMGDETAPGLRPRWDVQGSGLRNISPAVTPAKTKTTQNIMSERDSADSEPTPPPGGAALPDSLAVAPTLSAAQLVVCVRKLA